MKILHNKKPLRIYESIINLEENDILQLSDNQLENMTKVGRKSWRIRSLRYAKIIPESLLHLDPQSQILKNSLKNWVRTNIDKDGDYIFRGRLKPADEDWLWIEAEAWKVREEHDLATEIEVNAVLHDL